MSPSVRESLIRIEPMHDDPQTFDDAVIALDRIINKETKEYIRSQSDAESAATSLHSTLGRYLRNKWGLWSNSNLYKYIKTNKGIDHPDDMSHEIIVAFCRNLVK